MNWNKIQEIVSKGKIYPGLLRVASCILRVASCKRDR